MAKDKSEVKINGRAVFYAVLYESFRKMALTNGYALALHGSMVSDMDMVAIPWEENCNDEDQLIKDLSSCLDGTIWKEYDIQPHKKPHNRTVYTFRISGDWYIDLSIMPKLDLPF